ncbi:hypothetical protein G3I15_11760, partial [Streptomyces sp. SID10244]|nr:hypothetical protein [Streptomyces sp. SID10244]
MKSSVDSVTDFAARTKAPNASTWPPQLLSDVLTVWSARAAMGLIGDGQFAVSGMASPSADIFVPSSSPRISFARPSSFAAADDSCPGSTLKIAIDPPT